MYFSSILKESKNFFKSKGHRISKNNNIDKNWTNINERIFFRKKSYSPIITNSTRFIHASLIGSLWTFDISNFLECNGWKWWLRKASKANIFFVGFSYDERATGFEKIFSEMEWLFYRTFSNVTADFPISRRQFRWHYWQSYGICFIASADTKRNIFKYSSRLYYYFSLYSLLFLLKS